MADESEIVQNFLLRLSENRELLERYKRSPDQVMLDNGLSQKSIDILKTGDIRQIHELLYHRPFSAASPHQIHVIILIGNPPPPGKP